MIEFLKENIATIITMLTGIGAWGYERNRRKLEIKQFETSNNKSIMDLYQEALDDLKSRYDEKFKELEEEIRVLKTHLEDERKKYRSLKTAFDDYKRKNRNETN